MRLLTAFHPLGTTSASNDESLRGLAAAANALQHPDSISTSGSPLPCYNIRTVGPNGWETIANELQWTSLLNQRAFDIWADGVLNLIVELADPPGDDVKGKEI